MAVAFWGLSFVATRIALDTLTPMTLVAARLLIGAATLFVIGRMTRRPLRVAPGDRLRCFLLGLILAGHLIIQNIGLLKTTATNTAWIIGFIPVTIALAAHVFLGERLSLRGWAGIVLGALGILLVTTSAGLRFDDAKVGDMLQLISCCTWAAYTLVAVSAVRRNGALRVTFWSIGVAACIVTCTAGLQRSLVAPLDWKTFVAVTFLGVICSGLAYWLWYAAIAELGASVTGAYLYLEPFVTWAAAALVLRERLGAIGVAGGLTVLAGVWIVASSKRRDSKTSPSSSESR